MLATAWRTGMHIQCCTGTLGLPFSQGFSVSLRTDMLSITAVPVRVTPEFPKQFSGTLCNGIMVLTPIQVHLVIPENYFVVMYTSGPLHFSTLIYLTTQEGTIAAKHSN